MKLANGTGSIVCLDKSGKKRRKPWAVRITTGWKNGKQVRKYLGYYNSQADALIALAEYHKNHVDLDMSKLTLSEVYERWIKQIENRSSENVLKMHDMCYKRFGKIANKPIKDLKSVHLQDWMDDIDLKPGTKHKLKSTLSQLFDFAVNNDIVSKNYVKSVQIGEKIEKTGSIFTDDEIRILWQHADLEYVQDVLIMIYTGMRIGEAIAITSKTVNLEERYMIGGSKTEAGRDRVIPIHKAILPIVTERMERGKYLLYKQDGGCPSYSAMKHRFETLMAKLNMDHRWHDTRKTAVSIMHSAKIPMEIIRMIVGHSGKGITETVYLYKEPHELVEAIDLIKVDV